MHVQKCPSHQHSYNGIKPTSAICLGGISLILIKSGFRNYPAANARQSRIDYYHRFIERFPDVTSLATASEDEVLKYWQGLGYYSRARNLHKAARQIVSEHDGLFPNTYKEVIQLAGIGEYTAAAICSLRIIYLCGSGQQCLSGAFKIVRWTHPSTLRLERKYSNNWHKKFWTKLNRAYTTRPSWNLVLYNACLFHLRAMNVL